MSSALLLILLASCLPEKTALFRGQTMGTSYTVKYTPRGDAKTSILKEKTDSLLEALDGEVSTYREDSPLSRFNASKDTSKESVLPEDFYHILQYSLALAQQTHGLFDPTLGPLVNLWGHGPRGEKKIPSPELVARAKEATGYEKITLKSETKTLRKKHPRLQLDLSATAKGWAVDRVAGIMEKNGITRYMVEIGGEVKVAGGTKGKPWRIAIAPPLGKKQFSHIKKILLLKEGALATSGDYLNSFRERGVDYSHIMDSTTGRPVQDTLTSVTVVNPGGSTMEADGQATALLAGGLNRARVLAKEHNWAAFFFYEKEDGSLAWESTEALKVLGVLAP